MEEYKEIKIITHCGSQNYEVGVEGVRKIYIQPAMPTPYPVINIDDEVKEFHGVQYITTK